MKIFQNWVYPHLVLKLSTRCSEWNLTHGLSQQGVWVPFWTPKPWKRTPQDTQTSSCGISKNLNLKLIIEFFHLLIIPMTLITDIMPYFDEFIHVYGWNMSILWSPLKIWTPENFTTANFRHPVSKSWLRHWFDCMQSVATQISGQAVSGERQRAVSGNTLDHSAIRVGPSNGERQGAVSGNVLDHSAIRIGPCSGERWHTVNRNALDH